VNVHVDEPAGNVTPRALRLHATDNVIVAIDVLPPGGVIGAVKVANRVPKGHKLAVEFIAEGQPVLKFGQIIGFATRGIQPGEWVHEHNVAVQDFARDYHFAEDAKPETVLPLDQQATFRGYRRSNGKVGTRNYIGVLTSVNCSATAARYMAQEVERSGLLRDFPGVDGVIALVHGTGCGMSAKGEGFELLKRTQWGYAANPNMAAVLMVGLGCEVFQIARMKEIYGLQESDTFRSLTIQESGIAMATTQPQ